MTDPAVSCRNSNALSMPVSGIGANPLRRWMAAILLWHRVRRDERFLLDQPDHLLKDIGLARTDISPVVRGQRRS